LNLGQAASHNPSFLNRSFTSLKWKSSERSFSNSPDWIGTTQEFQLEPQSDGEVLLKFCHGGWKSGGDHW